MGEEEPLSKNYRRPQGVTYRQTWLSHKPLRVGVPRSLSHLSIQPTPVPVEFHCKVYYEFVHFYVLNFCWFGLNLGNSAEKTAPARSGLWDSDLEKGSIYLTRDLDHTFIVQPNTRCVRMRAHTEGMVIRIRTIIRSR